MSSPLALAESKRLVELEEIIERGVATFVQVGEALAEIRDSRLYRIEYDNFEDYCREEWQLDKRYCDRIISGARIVKTLGPIGPKPTTESQARPLTKLETPEARDMAMANLKCVQGSFEPKHEHKQAGVAYLASLWFEQP